MGEQTFAERLKTMRKKGAFSIADLARAIHVSEGALRQLESGVTKYPTFPVAMRLSRLLGVSPMYLFDGRGGRSTETESHSLASVVMAQERQDMQIAALRRRVSRLEDRDRGAPARTSRG